MEFVTSSVNETIAIGKKLGHVLKGGEIICLKGDLGTGKTHLTKGIAEGLEIHDHIVSPTFTIVNEYEGRLKLNHFDVYRVNDPDEISAIGFDEYIFNGAVSVIEWAEYIEEIIPENHIEITIDKMPEIGNNFRRIQILIPAEGFNYIKEIV